MKKVWAVLLVVLAIELAVAYTPAIVEAVESWLNFQVHMNIVTKADDGDNPGEAPDLMFVTDLTGMQELHPKYYWGDVEQGEHRQNNIYVKNYGDTPETVGLRFIDELQASQYMSWALMPEWIEIEPGGVVQFMLEVTMHENAPEGSVIFYGNGQHP